ncbi:MAG: hypothetical protein GQ574_07730 [Crocinitomix sp.]|nr:hypothetical protein [Crocinitomix sp.]
MNRINGVSRILKIVMVCLIVLIGESAMGQGASLSPYDLMDSYLEKRASYESSSTKKIADDKQKELDRLVKVLEDNAPNSYEYHLVKYINGNYDVSLKRHLFKAYELKPDEREVEREMFGYYALVGDKIKQKEFAKLIEPTYSKNTLNYYKLLASNPKVKTLFLSGEADAYPLLVLQSLGKVRGNIHLVNLDFLVNETYRLNAQKKIGMSNVQFLGQERMFINTALSALMADAFISTTVSQRYIREPADFCFLTGLHYQYHCPNQLEELTKFWKDGQQNLNGLTLNSRAEKSLYSNFLPPLLTLYKIKIANGEKDLALRKDIIVLAKKVSKEEKVEEVLKAYDQIE